MVRHGPTFRRNWPIFSNQFSWCGNCRALEDMTKLLLGVKPTEFFTCKDELKKTSLSNQLQIQQKSPTGKSKCECRGQMVGPRRRLITMLRTNEWSLEEKPLIIRGRIVLKTYKAKFKNYTSKSFHRDTNRTGQSERRGVASSYAGSLTRLGSTQKIKYSTGSYGEQTTVNNPESISGWDWI